MPSWSSLDGEAIPDHWIRIRSLDLAKMVGVIERDFGLGWWVKERNDCCDEENESERILHFFNFLFGIFQVSEEWKEREVEGFFVALFIYVELDFWVLLWIEYK